VPAGSHPKGASAWGVHDLVSNGWEWTSTVFGPFAGFEPMASYPEYSADFFDGQHYVMKGASPATAKELLRPSFRNWFRSNYPYVYAKFRTVGS
jgi:formylglycine-generating enzyme required for sulfatase activity